MFKFLAPPPSPRASLNDGLPRYEAPRVVGSGNSTRGASKRASLSSIASVRSSISRDSSDSPLSRRSSTSSRTSHGSGSTQLSVQYAGYTFEAVPTLTKTPWELERSRYRRPPVRRTRPKSSLSPDFFKRLPQDVYDCIVQRLEDLHFNQGSERCPTCYLRDLCNVSLTSRAWDKAAQKKLYGTVWLPASTIRVDLKTKSKFPGRLKLLRRTLRERPVLARLVRKLMAAEIYGIYLTLGPEEMEGVKNLLASIVMACPGLESLIGFPSMYGLQFDRLTHALSTRKSLKERIWIICDANDDDDDDDWEEASGVKSWSPSPHPFSIANLLVYGSNWPALETLFLHGHSPGVMNYRSFVATFRNLPSLKHLFISNFGADEFDDRTLQALPPLCSLRLEDLHGVTDRGLLRFASLKNAQSLCRLSLISLEIMSLLVISRLLTNLRQLKRFTLIQDGSPGLPPGAAMSEPIFSSRSLEFLHWDILVPNSVDAELAGSIHAGFFPCLHTIRAPCDHNGMFQSLCRPVAQMTRYSDLHLLNLVPSNGKAGGRTRGLSGLSGTPRDSETHYLRNLSVARRAAQERIHTARDETVLTIVVQDEEGVVQHTHTIKGFMGQLQSRIQYSLDPDIEGSDRAVIGLGDLTRPARGGLVDCCSGRWNGETETMMGQRDRGRDSKRDGYHAPRQKQRIVELMRFF